MPDVQTQEDYWNSETGDFWAEEADRLDAILAPFLDLILAPLKGETYGHIADLGCGAGALTLAAAQQQGAGTKLTGLDLSGQMLAVAEQRAAAAGLSMTFVQGDATAAELDPPIDALISRFGIMFFEEPLPAYQKLHAKMAPCGLFSAVCWQEMLKNQWLSLPLQSVLPLLDAPPEKPDPHAPGPFAFADKARVTGILTEAGFKEVAMEPWEGTLTLPGDTLEEASAFMVYMGPVKSLIRERGLDPEKAQTAVAKAIDAACGAAPFKLGAAVWHVTANA
ncbi:MAG: class I SAM-dependent methyltransferase [Sphingomonadales bacterium]